MNGSKFPTILTIDEEEAVKPNILKLLRDFHCNPIIALNEKQGLQIFREKNLISD